MAASLMNPANPLARHSREGGNPARKKVPRSGQNRDVVALRGDYFKNWIPAFAGMTLFWFNEQFVMKCCGSFALILLCVAPAAAWGQVLSDPTRPPPGFDGSAPTSGVMAYPKVRGLQSVIISPAHCAAIIDGKTVELGAKHGNERLVEISERGVVLQGEHGRRALTLFPAVVMKITEALPLDKQAVKCQFEQNKQAQNPPGQAGQKEKK